MIGFFSPRLLIPAWLFAKLAPSELQHIVLHECEHLRRYDDWINLLQQIGLVLFPLNPALFWLNRRLGLERELACDASVVASTEAPFDYARCLTRLAEHHLYRRSVALSLSAWGRQSELTRRVHNLLRPAVKLSRLQARFSVALICAGLIAGAVEMARFPHFFSFTDATTNALAAAPTGVVPIQANPRALPVVYRPTAQAHPTLLKAVLPARNRTSHPGQDPLRSPATRCPHLEESPLATTVLVNNLHRAEDSVRQQHRSGLCAVRSILIVLCRRSIQQRLADYSTVATQNTAMRKNYARIN